MQPCFYCATYRFLFARSRTLFLVTVLRLTVLMATLLGATLLGVALLRVTLLRAVVLGLRFLLAAEI